MLIEDDAPAMKTVLIPSIRSKSQYENNRKGRPSQRQVLIPSIRSKSQYMLAVFQWMRARYACLNPFYQV